MHHRASWLTVCGSLLAVGCQTVTAPSATSEPWGRADGDDVRLHRLVNRNGLELEVIDYGATIRALRVPDRYGQLEDIVLGFDSLDGYLGEHPYFGCVAGRCANRIANGRFELDGESFELATNDGQNHLHGGMRGFGRHVWHGESVVGPDGPSLRLERVSPDGEEGYPGNLRVTVVYTLTDDDALRAEITATSDAPTLCNLAQHCYWNLAGQASGPVTSQVALFFAGRYLPVDAKLIPTGEFAPVAGTPFDFRTPKPIGRDLAQVGGDPVGYDHDFVIDGEGLRPVCRVVDPHSGRVMTLASDQPGCQFYTGNFLDGTLLGKGGFAYPQYGGFCLETQHHPDSIHHPDWPTVVLRPGETYRHLMVTRFTTE